MTERLKDAARLAFSRVDYEKDNITEIFTARFALMALLTLLGLTVCFLAIAFLEVHKAVT